ncbi:MAG: hypothetical protein ABSG70_06790 [Terriglobales bacterium]
MQALAAQNVKERSSYALAKTLNCDACRTLDISAKLLALRLRVGSGD